MLKQLVVPRRVERPGQRGRMEPLGLRPPGLGPQVGEWRAPAGQGRPMAWAALRGAVGGELLVAGIELRGALTEWQGAGME